MLDIISKVLNVYTKCGLTDIFITLLDEPKTRPKLKLQPRTKPPEEVAAAVVKEEVAPTPTPPAASIFGGARPVDTAAREREIEERLSKQKDDKFDDSSR